MSPMSEHAERRLAELNRRARAEGIPVRFVRDEATPLQLPTDQRRPDDRCAICAGTIGDPRRRKHLRTGETVCGICASLAADHRIRYGLPWDQRILTGWLDRPAEAIRASVAKEFGFDPATRDPAEIAVEFTEVVLDENGVPVGVEHAVLARSPQAIRPRMSWDVLRHQGRV